MDLTKGNTQVAILAFTAGLLALSSENSQCQAQVLRPTLPFHLDDREPNQPLADSTAVGMGVDAIAPASAMEAVNASNVAPPPLPERGPDGGGPELLSGRDGGAPAGGRDVSAPEKKPGRKSYLPEQKPISQISIDVNSKAKAGSSLRPENVVGSATEALPAVMGATAAEMHLGWMATAQRTGERFGYKPLYFEEVNLERYGRTAGFWQPAISTTRFFGTVPLLPYKLAAHSPHRVYYWQWPYAAGAEAPRVRETFPLQTNAALVEAGVLTGAAFLIP